MTETSPAPVAAPTSIIAGVTRGWHRLQVVDAATGEVLTNVMEADSEAGTVKRIETKDGALVRNGDEFKIVTEDRAIRIVDLDVAPAPPAIDGPAPVEATAPAPAVKA